MNWINFLQVDQRAIYRGAVFCFPAEHPFEDTVHFMLIEEPESDSGYKFICSTGYHAGQTEVLLPKVAKDSNGGINLKWLQDNWCKWVYSKTPVEEVTYLESYSAETT
ncbi:immunity 45 family protein [Shewanella sp. AS16]|uniref:Imm45 family immunity protein n=1 Tax=Shewanella sp. AS16 TaxID=2907625 RepID=UPI001F2F9A90|nr:Imm45 family immunity protein [Shewanella sp. AS16]MCE9686430.1 immunity 45 family protein [Shewanella sp. AS16]